MKRSIFMCLFLFFATTHVSAEIITRELSYSAGEVNLKGYIAYDDGIEGKRPGILVVHEWWGHNDYAQKRARMLAELGYTALAVDMYGDGKKAEHPDSAGEFAGEVSKNMEGVGKERFLAALDLLRKEETVNADQIAAIGYCFGGGTVLHMARFGVDLRGVVSFHGSISTQTPAKPGVVKAEVLVCHGADDTFATEDQIEAFKKEMEDAEVKYQFIEYPGAMHSFTNPKADEFAEKFGLGIAYNKEADEKSWQDMQDFFDSIFDQE